MQMQQKKITAESRSTIFYREILGINIPSASYNLYNPGGLYLPSLLKIAKEKFGIVQWQSPKRDIVSIIDTSTRPQAGYAFETYFGPMQGLSYTIAKERGIPFVDSIEWVLDLLYDLWIGSTATDSKTRLDARWPDGRLVEVNRSGKRVDFSWGYPTLPHLVSKGECGNPLKFLRIFT
ncbi:MAG: hypothetical protein RI996_150 [Candidatus Parcubacteria bacterium]|jgi:hypothetical protein